MPTFVRILRRVRLASCPCTYALVTPSGLCCDECGRAILTVSK